MKPCSAATAIVIMTEFPDNVGAEFVDLDTARRESNPAQVSLIDELVQKLY